MKCCKNKDLRSCRAIIENYRQGIHDLAELEKRFCIPAQESGDEKFLKLSLLVCDDVIREVFCLLDDLSEYNSEALINHQRHFYGVARFCMEAVADLDYIKNNREQLDKFLSGTQKFSSGILGLIDGELSSKEASILLSETCKMDKRTMHRIGQSFPDAQHIYVLLCQHMHLNIFGCMIEALHGCENFPAIFYQVFSVIDLVLNKISDVMLDIPEFSFDVKMAHRIKDEGKNARDELHRFCVKYSKLK